MHEKFKFRKHGLTVDRTAYFIEQMTQQKCTEIFVRCRFQQMVEKQQFVGRTGNFRNENAVIGSAGNPNQVYLEFSNNPYGDGTGKTGTDKVTVFTYQLIVNKVDSHNHALKGAGFTLYKKNLAGNYVAIGTELKGADMTTFTWTGLDDGDYKLEESTVPEGYNKMADVVFSISAVHSETDGNPTLTSLDAGQMGTGVVDTGAITKDIVNNTGTVLPETGARGTMMLIGGGTMLVVVAAVFMVTRKKMSIYAD